ncbi:hypothetical protein RE428_14630 [Marinobacter nanhaiticus D15-8W]|nr:hypothetical protein RE428_14630 [Marinobacter nanhaiticus D15-8W]
MQTHRSQQERSKKGETVHGKNTVEREERGRQHKHDGVPQHDSAECFPRMPCPQNSVGDNDGFEKLYGCTGKRGKEGLSHAGPGLL